MNRWFRLLLTIYYGREFVKKVLKKYEHFQIVCNDQNPKSYEWAVRPDGVNIEHVPSRADGNEGKNITVEW